MQKSNSLRLNVKEIPQRAIVASDLWSSYLQKIRRKDKKP
jgi:hypothetical protein